jgi:hypothetical protein
MTSNHVQVCQIEDENGEHWEKVELSAELIAGNRGSECKCI